MFAYIKGTLQAKSSESVIIEAGGIGYRILVPLTAVEGLGQIGSNVKVHTYMHVREDACILFGFSTEEELKMFEQLIRVSGVGPKAAISLISHLRPSQFGLAVLTDDVDAFTKAPGIGRKTALKIILELKDKLKKEQGEELKRLSIGAGSEVKLGNKIQEAVAALTMLGYSSQEANHAISQVYSEEKSLETIIRDSLKGLVL